VSAVKKLAATLLVVSVGVLGACGGDDDDDTAEEPAAESTTTTAPATDDTGGGGESSGTCVAVAEPLPAGAPEVPVQEGPAPTELIVEDIVVGDGAEVASGATVTVDYIGVACSTGAIFDDSYSRGEPATFGLDQVITGWSEGLVGMKVGGQRLLGIPPELAYGEQGFPPDIGPSETLWFVVDMREVA
jgi:peptidylprolyl isomerase